MPKRMDRKAILETMNRTGGSVMITDLPGGPRLIRNEAEIPSDEELAGEDPEAKDVVVRELHGNIQDLQRRVAAMTSNPAVQDAGSSEETVSPHVIRKLQDESQRVTEENERLRKELEALRAQKAPESDPTETKRREVSEESPSSPEAPQADGAESAPSESAPDVSTGTNPPPPPPGDFENPPSVRGRRK